MSNKNRFSTQTKPFPPSLPAHPYRVEAAIPEEKPTAAREALLFTDIKSVALLDTNCKLDSPRHVFDRRLLEGLVASTSCRSLREEAVRDVKSAVRNMRSLELLDDRQLVRRDILTRR